MKIVYGLMGHHQKDQYMYYRGPRRKRQRKRQKFNALNFPYLKEKAWYPDPGSPNIPNKMNLKRLIIRHIIIKLATLTAKERTLKSAREKQLVAYKRTVIRQWILQKLFRPEDSRMRYSKCWNKKKKNCQPRTITPLELKE